MSRADLLAVQDAITRDRSTIRTDLMGCLPEAGKVDRERLRRILAADRADLYRTEGARNTAEFIASFFHISKWKAMRWIEAAHALEYLPHIAAALEAGALSLDKTVELTRFATPENECKLVGWARRVTVGCIRRRGDEAIKASREEIRDAHHNRELKWWWNDHSLFFEGSLPAERGAAFVEAVERLAHELPEDPDATAALFEEDEPPSMTQRRADALFLLATSSESGETAKPTVMVYVPVGALTNDVGNGLVDHGPVLDPELVRMLACDARIQVVLEDPAGHALAMGSETRFPSRNLRRAVLRRDGHTCAFPGCGMKRFVDLHHIVPWPRGRTEYWNLITLCPVHHSLIHKMGWRITFEDGHPTWFRPLGRRYEPGPAPPDPPSGPERHEPSTAEAAAYSGLDRWVSALAGGKKAA